MTRHFIVLHYVTCLSSQGAGANQSDRIRKTLGAYAVRSTAPEQAIYDAGPLHSLLPTLSPTDTREVTGAARLSPESADSKHYTVNSYISKLQLKARYKHGGRERQNIPRNRKFCL